MIKGCLLTFLISMFSGLTASFENIFILSHEDIIGMKISKILLASVADFYEYFRNLIIWFWVIFQNRFFFSGRLSITVLIISLSLNFAQILIALSTATYSDNVSVFSYIFLWSWKIREPCPFRNPIFML